MVVQNEIFPSNPNCLVFKIYFCWACRQWQACFVHKSIHHKLTYFLLLLAPALKGRYTFGNCQRPVFSLGVSHHNHKITNLWKFGLNWSSKLRENDERKNTLVGRICVLSDKNKRLLARSLLLFYWEVTSFSKTGLLQRESFPTMLVTKSVFKLIFVMSNYQTCTFPLSRKLCLTSCLGNTKWEYWAQFHRAAFKHYANQNKVTSQNTVSHVQFVTGILLVFAQ